MFNLESKKIKILIVFFTFKLKNLTLKTKIPNFDFKKLNFDKFVYPKTEKFNLENPKILICYTPGPQNQKN